MKKAITILKHLDLQIFADGGDGGTGAAGETGVTPGVSDPGLKAKGVNSIPEPEVKYGIQDDAQPADVQPVKTVELDPEQKRAEFEKLIKGEYKDLYDKKMQDTIRQRLKGTKDTVEKYESLYPVLEMLSKKYGVDANDVAALNKAIEDDDSYYEDEALKKGISVEQLKSIKKIERENAELTRKVRAQEAEKNAEKIYSGWLDQAEKAKQTYPALDLKSELHNPQFADLLKNGIDVATAYTVIHKDEIIPAAMQYTAQAVEQKLTNKIIANGTRPTENGINSQSSIVVKSDVSQLTKADREDIIRRVARGEKIRF